ncbi:MAG: PAS domain S-box protein [Promethearchaeota archaeon]
MRILVLSHRNLFFPPYIFLKVPGNIERDDIRQVPTLMDIYEDGFFKHMFGTFKTANLLFEIPSKYSRIKKEQLLISIIADNKSRIDTSLAQELLEGFIEEFKKIKKAYKAFYVDSQVYQGDPSKLEEIKSLLNTFNVSFPEESVIFEQKEAKILIYGLSMAGKTTIIRTRRKTVSKALFPTINVDISRILVNNVSLLTYDTPGQVKFKEIWKPYLNNQDGLIFVLDVSDKIKFTDACTLLHEVATAPELNKLPLLILFNKVDIEQPNVDYLVDTMELEKLGNRPMKYFLTSGITNENIDEAFDWLSLKIAERIESYTPRTDIGIIFCRWDENLGIKIEAVHPKDAFDNPELISVKSFSISQYIFGGGEFKRASVILPFPHLNSNAAIYFDYVADESIRGGLLPLSLIIYYNDKIPKSIINQFSHYILKQFDIIKSNYLNNIQVLEILKETHSTISSQIDIYKPSIQALKIAELRYEALFKAARDAILIIDKKSGIIMDANQQAEELFQRPFEDFIGFHSSQLLSDIINIDFNEEIFDQLNNPLPLRLDVINNSGNLIPVEINANEVQMGGQIFIQYIIRDISKRLDAEMKLKNSEIRYRHLFKDSPFSIILIDPNGIIVDCNPAFEKILGYTRDELMGKGFVDVSLIHQEYLVDVLKRFRKEERGKIFPPIEIQLYQKDGSLIWVSMQSSFVEIGSETFYQIICHDVTEQKKTELELKKISKLGGLIARIISRFVGIKDFNQAVYDSLREIGEFISATRSYIYIFNNNYNFMKKNYVWYSKLIYPLIDLPQFIPIKNFPWVIDELKIYDHFYVDDIDNLPNEAKMFKNFLDQQKIENILVFSIKIDNELDGIMCFDNLSDKDYWIEQNIETLGIFADILKNAILRNLAEENLRISEETFHDEFDREYFYKELFINDINNIVNNLQSLLDEYNKQDNQVVPISPKELLNNVKSQCINAQLLIYIIERLTLLNDSKIAIEKVNLLRVIDDVIGFITSSYTNRKINIVVEHPGEYLYVKADKFLIDVFVNLIISSIRYSQKTSIDFKIILFKVKENNVNYVKIKFIDYKKEILDIEKEMIFKKAREKDSRIKEIILGFLLVERILNNYKGKIWVEEGNFVILIPET